MAPTLRTEIAVDMIFRILTDAHDCLPHAEHPLLLRGKYDIP